MSDASATTAPVEAMWAVLELMGHRVMAGRVSEVEMFGRKLIRIDVPVVDAEGAFAGRAETHYHSPDALYGLHPTTEEAVMERLRPRRMLGAGVDCSVAYGPDELDDDDPVHGPLDEPSCDDELDAEALAAVAEGQRAVTSPPRAFHTFGQTVAESCPGCGRGGGSHDIDCPEIPF